MSRREVLWPDFHPNVPLHTLRMARPETAIEALMQNRDDPADTEASLAVREAVANCFDTLSEQDQYILNARIFEQLSVRELGARLGVSHVHVIRLTRKATDRLTECLQHNDLVRERIGMEATTWDDAAARNVREYVLKLADGQYEPAVPAWDLAELRDAAWEEVESLGDPLPFINMLALYGLYHLTAAQVAALPDLLVYKQRRYGCDNILRFGFHGIVIRMSDKVERILQAKRRGDSDDEDPFTDLVGYAVIANMVRDNTFTLPLKEDS